MKFYCPMCKVKITEEKPSEHFRFTHHISNDDVVDFIFKRFNELDDRVTNLCELLEIKEK